MVPHCILSVFHLVPHCIPSVFHLVPHCIPSVFHLVPHCIPSVFHLIFQVQKSSRLSDESRASRSSRLDLTSSYSGLLSLISYKRHRR
ncbi:hypothetical protein NHX12_006840, partial [Muraenolepis orangiensis]